MGSFYYLAIGSGTAKGSAAVGVRFAHARMKETFAAEWLSGRLPLKSADGKLVEPVMTVPEPTSNELARIPGAKDAWDGLAKLNLSACALQGSEIVIKETWAKEFGQAPHDVAEAFAGYQHNRDKTWRQFLSQYSGSVRAEGDPAKDDDREEPKVPNVKGEEGDGLTEYESKAKVAGVRATLACQDPVSGVTLVMGGKHSVYLLSEGGRQDHC